MSEWNTIKMDNRPPHCGICTFWAGTHEGGNGSCKRHAPVAMSNTDGLYHAMPVWPQTYGTDKCGDFGYKIEPSRTQDAATDLFSCATCYLGIEPRGGILECPRCKYRVVWVKAVGR